MYDFVICNSSNIVPDEYSTSTHAVIREIEPMNGSQDIHAEVSLDKHVKIIKWII